MFCKNAVLRNFTKFTEKHLCYSLFLNKVSGLKSATSLKRRLWHQCFPVNFVKFLRAPFSIEHLLWLLLYHKKSTGNYKNVMMKFLALTLYCLARATLILISSSDIIVCFQKVNFQVKLVI